MLRLLPELALPVGISFFSFHAISLMVDAYRGRIPVRVRIVPQKEQPPLRAGLSADVAIDTGSSRWQRLFH